MANKKRGILFKLFVLISVLTIAAFLLFNENGIVKYIQLKSELKKLNDEILKSETRLHALDAEIDSLKNNMNKIERVARERYNMMLPNENALKIQEK